MRSSLARRRRLLHARSRAALRSARGAFDLPSIIAGVVVVGILTAGVLAAVFGVIPFAQDNGAKQDLSAVRTAEGVAKAKDGRFLNTAGLAAAGYVSNPVAVGEAAAGGFTRAASITPARTFAVETDTDGTCYVSVSKSPTGKLFAGTSTRPDAFQVASAADIPECLPADTMGDLFESLPGYTAGVTPPAASSPLAGPASITISALTATSADFSWAAVPGADGYKVDSRTNAGPWTAVSGKQPATTTRITGSIGDVVEARVASVKGADTSSFTVSASATLAAPTGSALVAWGSHQHGEFGIDADPYNRDGNSFVPVGAAPSLTGKAISALDAGTKPCVLTGGTVSCWGYNRVGTSYATGTGSSATTVFTPQPLSSAGGMPNKAVTKLSSGSAGSCAIENGDVYCWGGSQGSANITGSTSAVMWPQPAFGTDPIMTSREFTDVTVGTSNVCAISEGKAYCWGEVSYGANGTDTYTKPSSSIWWTSPRAVDTTGVLAGKTVTSMSIGQMHTCAVADGAAYCWGYNTYGSLGDGTNNTSAVPVAVDASGVLAGKKVTAITAGVYSTCAIADGASYCWGRASNGTLGNGSTVDSNRPVAVATDGVLAGKTVTDIDTNGNTTCVLSDGAAYCWGLNNYGNLGNGLNTTSAVPVAVDTSGSLKDKRVVGISVGNTQTFALVS